MMDLILNIDNAGEFKDDGVTSMDKPCSAKVDSK